MATPAFPGPRTLRPRLFAGYLGEGVARGNSPAPGLDKGDFTRCLVSPLSTAPTRPRGFGPGVTLQRQPCSPIPRAGPRAGAPLPPAPPNPPGPAPAACRPPPPRPGSRPLSHRPPARPARSGRAGCPASTRPRAPPRPPSSPFCW